MKNFILLTVLILTRISFAQQTAEFSFQLYFEDAVGNKDTVTLGYDALATDTIDTSFGEINILNKPWGDSTFEVRITDKMPTVLYSFGQETFRTKKQIVRSYCMTSSLESRRIFVDVKNAVFPIVISFDTLLYQNQCVNGSTIDVQDPELHIDPVEGPPIYFFDYIFKNSAGGYYTPFDRDSTDSRELVYKDTDGKYIFTYLITLKDKRWMTLNRYDVIKDNFQIYPNPFLENIEIQSDVSVSTIQLTDIKGKQISFEQNENTIRPLDCSSGIYFLSFEANGKQYNFKIVKQ